METAILGATPSTHPDGYATARMIEVVLNDRLGKKIRVKCNEDDTVGDLKKLIAAQTGTRPEKLRIQKWCAATRHRPHHARAIGGLVGVSLESRPPPFLGSCPNV